MPRSPFRSANSASIPRTVAGLLTLFAGSIWLWPRSPSSPSIDDSDLCSLYRQRLSWYQSSREVAERYEISEAVIMSFLFQESGFRADARPPRRRFFGFLPGRRPSSAYGYAQAIDSTWQQFESELGQSMRRDRFADAAHFVAWYSNQLKERLGTRGSDIQELYFAYHHGPTGYGRRDRSPPQSATAAQVASRTRRYAAQLEECRRDLDRLLLGLRLRRAIALGLLIAGVLLAVRSGIVAALPSRREDSTQAM